MKKTLQQIIEEAEKTWGLEAYTLQHHAIFIEKNIINGHAYLLEMEWVIESDDDCEHPHHSVLLEINLDTKKLCRLFIKGENHLSKPMPEAGDMEAVIDWIEENTGLLHGRQFMRTIEQKDELFFHAAVDHIPVFPTGSIHVRFNKEGKLSLFSIDGHFPSEEEIHWEPFDLTTTEMEVAAKQQLKLIELPIECEKKWISTYYIPVHYISNDGKRIVLEEDLDKPEHYVDMDDSLKWDSPIDEPFIKQEVELSMEVSAKEALENRVPKDEPLTAEEINQTKDAVTYFMQQSFSDDSGEWKLTGVWPNFGYIFAEIKRAEHDAKMIERKLRLIIDRDTKRVLNYINNDDLLDTIQHYAPAEKEKISKEDAFHQLKDEIDVIPVYIYDRDMKKYYLSGRVTCPYGIRANDGEMMELQQNDKL